MSIKPSPQSKENSAFLIFDELQGTPPSDRLLEVQQQAEKLYGPMYERIVLPTLTLEEDGRYPDGYVRLNPWYFEMLRQGNISPRDAATIRTAEVLWDTTIRPGYYRRQRNQLYGNGVDPLADELAYLRAQGAIEITNVPNTSRFGISFKELDRSVLPLHGQNLGIQPNLGELVVVSSYAVFNFVGNMRHPELGQVNTSEWMSDKFVRDSRHLIGGHSDCGGLANVNNYWYNHQDSCIGFRPLVVFPQKA